MSLRILVLPIGALILCAAAWLVPSLKPDAALGRYSYPQLMTAIAVTWVFIATCCIAFAPASRRRARSFQMLALSLGLLVALAAAEAIAMVAPLKENPFYDFNEGGITADKSVDPRLPFTRPANLRWEGWSQGDVPEWIPDSPSQRRRISFQTDNEGFRNSVEISQADLVFIGDSFTEAGNVLEEESFVRRVAAKTGRSAKNLGRFAYAPQPELIVLEQYGIKCRPQVVIWQLCEGNDLKGALQYGQWLQQWESSGRPSIERSPTPRYTSWELRSLSYALFQSLRKRDRWWLTGTYRDADGAHHEMRFGYWPTEHHYPLGIPGGPWGETGHPAWTLLTEVIGNAKTFLDQREIDLVILYIPMKVTVFADHVSLDEWSRDRAPRQLKVPAEQSMGGQLERVCRTLGIPFIDTTGNLETAAAAGELVFIPNDTHLSPRGHQVVSEMIVEVLNDILEPAK